MFTKILVPLNGSDVAEHALAPALAVANACGGSLIVLCTCTTKLANDPLQNPVNDFDWFWLTKSDDPSQSEAKAYLDELLSRLSDPDIGIQSLFVRGDEAGAIIGIAEAKDIDLIVMTKHCQSGARHHQLGDVTERVLHHASCSVMVICSESPRGGATASVTDPEHIDRTPGPVQI